MKTQGTKTGRTEITEASVLATIKGGATSLTQIAHGLGFTGSVGGATAKKIRAVVPDVARRLKEGDAGPVVKVEPVKAGKPMKIARKRPGAAYHGILYQTIVDVASKGEMTGRECDEKVAKILSWPIEKVAMGRCVVANEKHRSNNGKTKNMAPRGRIHIEVLQTITA